MNVNLLAYTAIDGIPTMTDSEVMGLFDRMVEDKTVWHVFYDGSVKTREQFLHMMKHGHNQLFLVSVDREVAGIIWLNDFDSKRAYFHFCFFSNVWGQELPDVGRHCVMELLYMKRNDGYVFDALMGLTPEPNRLAHKWCKAMGFTVLGTMPKACWYERRKMSVPGTYYYVERGEYGQKGR